MTWDRTVPGPRARARSRAALASILTLAIAAGCDSSTGPSTEVLELVSINGEALPGPYPDPLGCCATLQVVDGTLTLRDDGTFTQLFRVECRPGLPPGTTCEVSGGGRLEAEGAYSRGGGYIEPAGGVRLGATYTPDRVTIDVGVSPSQGLYPRFLLEYAP